MKTFATMTLAAMSLAASGCAQPGARLEDAPAGQTRLVRMLEGRVPGAPQSCIPAMLGHKLRVVDRTALVYDAGTTIWVAKPTHPASLDARDILIVERTGVHLCKQDVVRTLDRSSGFLTGVVFLSDFVPYRMP